MPQRIERYKGLVQKVRDLEAIDPAVTLRPDLKEELKSARAEVNEVRAELQAALDEQTQEMKKGLAESLFLEPHRLRYGFLAAFAFSPHGGAAGALTVVPSSQVRQNYYFALKTQAPAPVPEPVQRHWYDWDSLNWIDFLTRWGVTLIGCCLLVGLFTRSACALGALFLLTIFLAQPAIPRLPIPPDEETHYQLIFKTLIEMVALLALATTASGRWVGLDGLVRCLLPWNWRTRPAAPREQMNPARTLQTNPNAEGPGPVLPPPVLAPAPRPVPVSTMKEPSHGH
jgi:uncharacterized membrane protein YphA (DoxX/SURF4 family)